MAVYSDVISLKQTIHRLIDSVKFSLDPATRKTLEFASKDATFLQEILLKDGGRGGKRLKVQISEAVHKLEDFLELHQSDLFLDQDNHMPIDSDRVREEVCCFAESVNKLREDHTKESGEEDDATAAATATATESSEMIGFSDELTSMNNHVRSVLRPEDCGVLSIVGPAGTGRSLAAKRVLDEVRGCRGFDHCLWVRIGSVYKHETILQHILFQLLITENGGSRAINFRGGEKTAKDVLPWLLGWRRYLIVLDDVCDTDILEYLLPLFPLQNNQSAVLVTTWSMRIAVHAKPYSVYRMDDVHINFGDIHWDVFRYVLFRQEPVPPELEAAGRKIARNCGGLSLCACKVLLYLWNAERTPQMWNRLASDHHHPLFQVVDEILEMQNIEKDFSNLTVEPDAHRVLSPFVLDNGISADIKIIKNLLFPEKLFPRMEVISFLGMAGIGKTTFVRKIFEDFRLQTLEEFNPRPRVFVWVSLGPKYDPENILIDILTQIFPGINEQEIKEMDDDLIRKISILRFLLVLDDVWSEEALRNLAKLYPNIWGRALVTTRFAPVAKSEMIDIVREMPFLTKEESWDLLCHKVFGEVGLCPHELKKAGEKIAANCDGLPLTVVRVANLISRDLSPHYWNDVANKNSDFKNAIKELSEELLPLYESLPIYLRSCFLYMGVFPQNDEVSTKLLFDLWISEGFLERGLSKRDEDVATQCLLELVNRSLVMVCQEGSTGCGVKSCRLNSVLWYLSNSEAVKTEFFHDFDHSIQGMKKQRRFCIRNSVLLSVKDIHDSMVESAATARSLVCTGPYQRYQLQLCFQLRLLRVLHVLVIRFYEFPIEVVKLIHLRHLAITCDGNLPTSISQLWNLEFLIVRRHLRISSSSTSSSLYLPSEIWDMKELRHLQVMGSILPTPSPGTILPNLVTLLDVSSHTCIEEVFEATPNLEKLGIQMEIAPGDAPPFHHLNRISGKLRKLKSFKCVVANPEVVALPPPPPLSAFPSSIEKLSLTGLGYPWEYMDTIGHLQNLRVLKLQCYAFQGDKWETGDHAFENLIYLTIEDTDLVRWKSTIYSFSKLKHLSIKHCYNLEELPNDFVRNEVIEVIDCNPFATNWANIMKERNGFRAAPNVNDRVLETRVQSSWDVGRPQYQRKTASETPLEKYISSMIDRWG